MQLSLISLALTRIYGGGATAFSPLSLFAGGEQGVWYDPSDLSTMFQDSLGTTPVTAAGQPVGLILDKSKGLALGAELVTNGGFDSATGWTLSAGFTISGSALNIAGVSSGNASNTLLGLAGKYYELSVDVVSLSGGTLNISIGSSGKIVSTPGIHTFRVLAAVNNSLFILISTGTVTAVINSISAKEVAGNHASQATAAKRPLLQNDGVNNYLDFDGVDDGLVTSAIDLSVTNKLTNFAGIRKSSDAARGVIVEMGANYAVAGSFGIEHSDGGPNVRFTSPQGALAYTVAAPVTAVVSQIMDNAAPTNSVIGRWNGVQVVQGLTGPNYNFGNRQVGVGVRVEGTLPLNGNIYSLIVLGRTATTQEVADTESWVAAKTGVTLP